MLRFRPRISLLTAFLLMTIVGMAIVIVRLWREVGPMRAENSWAHAELTKLRAELGYLTIDDPSKAYAITLQAFDNDANTSHWRLYLPPGQYALNMYSGHLPGHVASSTYGTEKAWFEQAKEAGTGRTAKSELLSGEFVLEARTVKVRDKRMLVTKLTKRSDQAITSQYLETAISEPNGEWVGRGTRRITTDINRPIQNSFEQDEPILLMLDQRVRYMKNPDGTAGIQPTTEAADAYALWIEPAASAAKPPNDATE